MYNDEKGRHCIRKIVGEGHVMKKIICSLFCLVLIVLCAAALADAELTAANFPDAAFREYLRKNWDNNGNGVIESKEMRSLLFVDNMNITSVKGVELLQGLTLLSCTYNQISSIDVSHNTALTILQCGSNPKKDLVSSLFYRYFAENFVTLCLCVPLKQT